MKNGSTTSIVNEIEKKFAHLSVMSKEKINELNQDEALRNDAR